ncbi:DNA repair protein RadC [Sporolactobacillus shoreicorticis]|uniref:DNA repair protein RadC n=1 Tax=Sporolactobacillus shoreicorticis TaxID=1923877 RepID=A0ABW5S9Y8_9BACL|nr:DNA repair protein RadC [Sporolactobacillus shoreicorticis]MCO7126064.1 DNA repair protein RadC [Sporolactobacillus shoreicorticis]
MDTLYGPQPSIGIQQAKSAKRVSIISLRVVKEKSTLYSNRFIRSPEDGYQCIKPFLELRDREYFIVVTLDTKNQPTSINICHIGNLNSSIVHPREVFKTAVLSNAASILIAHNHPSGIVDPSREDKEVTKRLVSVGNIIGIEVLDHLIIGDNKYLSFKEQGLI